MGGLIRVWQSFSEIVHFWGDLSWRAICAIWSITVDRGWKSLAFLVAVFLVTALADYSGSDRKAVTDHLKAVAGGLFLVLAIMFAYQMIVTPFNASKELRVQNSKLDKRIKSLYSKIPVLNLTSEQRERFKQLIQPLAGSSVTIEYLNDPYQRPRDMANEMEELFRSAEWKVTLKESDLEGAEIAGLAMRITKTIRPKGQQTVHDAFKDVGFPCGIFGSHLDVSDGRVELVIGEL